VALVAILLSLLFVVNSAHAGFGEIFEAGILLEVEPRPGVEVGALQARLDPLGLKGAVEIRRLSDSILLIHIAEQPGDDAAQLEALSKVVGAIGDSVTIRKTDVIGARAAREMQLDGLIFLGIVMALATPLVAFLARRRFRRD